MSSQDDEALLQSDAVETELITDAEYDIPYTSRRETSCWAAMARGLAEYVSQLRTQLKGADVRLLKVFTGFADPEQLARYPSATVYSEEPGIYDTNNLTPIVEQLPDGRVLARVAEFTQRYTIDIWCTGKPERDAIVAMLEDALDPVDWMSGLRLRLPHYHNAVATFLKDGVTYTDIAGNAERRWRLASFTVMGSVPQIRFIGAAPALDVRINAEVSEP